MRFSTTQSTALLPDIFGGTYVQEQHDVDARAAFLEGRMEIEDGVRNLRTAMFDEVLKSLRRALSL